jgi:replication-associated recombination protein RarA
MTGNLTHPFEKYRPRRIAECVLLPHDREVFESFIAKARAPHMLLIGPPGVGKTSVAMALVNQMNWEVMKRNAAVYTNIEAARGNPISQGDETTEEMQSEAAE